MTKEWIKQKIEEAHGNAVDKGFYTCPECESNDNLEGYPDPDCSTCNGTGKDPNKNIGELLMDIVELLGYVNREHREGRFVDDKDNCMDFLALVGTHKWPCDKYVDWFKENILNTREDKIADVFIRLFDLCGYLGINIETEDYDRAIPKTFTLAELLLLCTRVIGEMQSSLNDKEEYITISMSYLYDICDIFKIPIQKHIEAKMAYNKTRPVKLGKEY